MFVYFSTITHYDENEDGIPDNNSYSHKEINENDMCLVCWDRGEEVLSKMRDIVIKTCVCDGVIHNSCFQKWLIKKRSCLICREHFDKRYGIYDCENPYRFYISLFVEKVTNMSKAIINLVMRAIVLSLVVNMCVHIILVSTKKHDEIDVN
jgi:hypothetical protein